LQLKKKEILYFFLKRNLFSLMLEWILYQPLVCY
jgi:hypothetical protein